MRPRMVKGWSYWVVVILDLVSRAGGKGRVVQKRGFFFLLQDSLS